MPNFNSYFIRLIIGIILIIICDVILRLVTDSEGGWLYITLIVWNLYCYSDYQKNSE